MKKRTVLTLSSVVLLVILALVDYLLGYSFQISFLYALPIIIVAFFIGKRTAYVMSLVSAVTWLAVDIISEARLPSIWFHAWNLTLRFSFFIFITYGISWLAIMRKRQEHLSNFVVHDLKSPLANIISALQLVEEDRNNLPSELEKFIRIALASANNMLSFINSLLDLTKMESHRFIIKTENVNLDELAAEAIGQISVFATKNSVEVDTNINVPNKVIHTDYWLLLRVLVNLLSNAVRFSPDKSLVKLSMKDSGDKIRFEVLDQGPGIDPTLSKKIFDKYFHADPKRKTILHGTGLGLSFCRMAVRNLGGDIWIESEVGKGTNVIFTATKQL